MRNSTVAVTGVSQCSSTLVGAEQVTGEGGPVNLPTRGPDPRSGRRPVVDVGAPVVDVVDEVGEDFDTVGDDFDDPPLEHAADPIARSTSSGTTRRRRIARS
jgi:hypothetical protein